VLLTELNQRHKILDYVNQKSVPDEVNQQNRCEL
jgi:hypothetical protein